MFEQLIPSFCRLVVMLQIPERNVMALSSFQRLTYLFARTFASDFYRRCVVNIFARLFLTSVWYHRQCFKVAFFYIYNYYYCYTFTDRKLLSNLI